MNFQPLTEYLDHVDANLIPSRRMVIYRNHEKLYEYFGARKDLYEKEEKKQYYFLYSTSKVITCTAAMQLVEKGLIDLDAPVSTYLPEYADLKIETPEGNVKAKNTLTMRHLFTMTGGLTYQTDHEEIRKTVAAFQGKASTREVVRAIARMPLSFEPGARYQYSLGHDVIAAVIEVVTGKLFSEYLQENIFEPVGMKHTTFVPTAEVLQQMHQQYVVDPWKRTAVEMEPENNFRLSECYESGGAGLISTAEDYALFTDALASGATVSGKTLLQPETVALMTTNQLSEPILAQTFVGRWYGYGYGLGVRTLMDPEKARSLSSVGEFGWDGAAGAYALIDVKNQLSCFFGMHVRSCGDYAYPIVHLALRNLMYQCIESET